MGRLFQALANMEQSMIGRRREQVRQNQYAEMLADEADVKIVETDKVKEFYRAISNLPKSQRGITMNRKMQPWQNWSIASGITKRE